MEKRMRLSYERCRLSKCTRWLYRAVEKDNILDNGYG